MKEALTKVEHVSLTTDLWKNKKLEYFLAITCHFLDKQFEYKSLVICFRRFHSTHTSNDIRSFILNEIDKLGITSKIVSITTDNEPAVKNACTGLLQNSTWISCQAHNLNLVIKNGLKLWKKNES